MDDPLHRVVNGYVLDLRSGKQTLVEAGLSHASFAVSVDGRPDAYSIPEGESYSIRVGDVGAASSARLVCKGCGKAFRFSADGRLLFLQPEVRVREHPTDSITYIDTFGEDLAWVTIVVRPRGEGRERTYIIPWILAAGIHSFGLADEAADRPICTIHKSAINWSGFSSVTSSRAPSG